MERVNTANRAEEMARRAGVETLIPVNGAETTTAPRILQNEQLHRRAVFRPSVSSTVNFTAPQ